MTERRREIDELRRQMNEADVEIVRALERRARLAKRVAELRGGGVALTGAQDADAIEALVSGASEELAPAAVRSVLREVHAATSSLEAPVKVAYPGQPGDFGYLAALQHFGSAAQFLSSDDVAQTVDQVSRKRADLAVIPYENSADGTVYESVLALLPTDLVFVAKTEISATLSLVGQGSTLESHRRVYCSPQHRLAAKRFLSALPAGVDLVETASPAAAVEAAREDATAAAVIPEPLGRSAGLDVITTNIGDRADLSFRYVVVSHRPAPRSTAGNDSTAFVFGVHDEPGALFDVLKHFAERGVSLRTIQSRPAPGERWTYLFFAEVAGHATDRPVVTAFEAIKRQTRFLKVLGSFPAC